MFTGWPWPELAHSGLDPGVEVTSPALGHCLCLLGLCPVQTPANLMGRETGRKHTRCVKAQNQNWPMWLGFHFFWQKFEWLQSTARESGYCSPAEPRERMDFAGRRFPPQTFIKARDSLQTVVLSPQLPLPRPQDLHGAQEARLKLYCRSSNTALISESF